MSRQAGGWPPGKQTQSQGVLQQHFPKIRHCSKRLLASSSWAQTRARGVVYDQVQDQEQDTNVQCEAASSISIFSPQLCSLKALATLRTGADFAHEGPRTEESKLINKLLSCELDGF